MAERGGSSGKRGEKGQRGAHDVPLVQWLVSGVALLVVVASFAIVAYQGVRRDDAPPLLTVAVDSIVRDGAGYAVHVTVRNDGGQTAANLQVQGTVGSGGTAESVSIQFDYLAPGAHASGALAFSSDPRTDGLQVRVGGFTIP